MTENRTLTLLAAFGLAAAACTAEDLPGPAVGQDFPHSLEAPDQRIRYSR